VNACKGTEVTATKLSKNWGEVFFALERVLNGDETTELLSPKIIELSPFPHSFRYSSTAYYDCNTRKQNLRRILCARIQLA
jgi:hypothetical protein